MLSRPLPRDDLILYGLFAAGLKVECASALFARTDRQRKNFPLPRERAGSLERITGWAASVVLGPETSDVPVGASTPLRSIAGGVHSVADTLI